MSDNPWVISLIPLIPGVGAIINGLFGKRLPKSVIHGVAVGAVALSLLIALACFFGPFMSGGGATEIIWRGI